MTQEIPCQNCRHYRTIKNGIVKGKQQLFCPECKQYQRIGAEKSGRKSLGEWPMTAAERTAKCRAKKKLKQQKIEENESN